MNARRDSPESSRIEYLDSIRGLAALQVIFLHAFAAFVPGLVFSAPQSPPCMAYAHASPFFFLYDGYSAVYIFFVLSGYVLSGSFGRQLDRPIAIVGARILRLGIPALAATVFAAAVLFVYGRQNVAAGNLVQSDWFVRQWNPELSLASILQDGGMNALFLGYRELSPLTFLGPWQQSIETSFVAPLWTLSIEFYGSLIVLALCLIARRSRKLWWLGISIGLISTVRSAYICFLAGHIIAAIHAKSDERSRGTPHPVLATCSILIGLFLCVSAEIWQPNWLQNLCNYPIPLVFPAQLAPLQQKAFGAILFLSGVLNLPLARSWLSRPGLVRWSKLSFPIYLFHWPILFGPSAAILVLLNDVMGLEAAKWGAVVAMIALSILAAMLFQPVDRSALYLSKMLRRRRMSSDRKEAQLKDRFANT